MSQTNTPHSDEHRNEHSNQHGQPIGHPVDNWQGCARPVATTLTGQYCQLAPLDIEQHSNPLYQQLCIENPDTSWTYLPYGPFSKQTDFEQWLNKANNNPEWEMFTLLSPQGSPLGLAAYLRIFPNDGSVEVGHIHYGPALKRSTAATEAMYLMMKYAFELGYRRYEWKCNALNAGSLQAAKRLGFQYEGTFRNAQVVKGHNRDTAWLSITDCEWPRIKAALECWLSAENLLATGKQKQALAHFLSLQSTT